MTEAFTTPAPVGQGIQWADYNGALVLIHVHETVTDVKTVHGPTDAIRADVTILSPPDQGETFTDTLIFPKLLQTQLRSKVGGKVLAKVGQGTAKPGQSAPWILNDPTEGEKAQALAYLNKTTIATAAPPF